jgi:hypothetical protein
MQVYLELAQYPILSDKIRERMRERLFSQGVIGREQFEREVQEKAIVSQKREGLTDPYSQEPDAAWRKRLERVRDNLTDAYFAHNFPHGVFEEIVQSVLREGAPYQDIVLTFNPELAPLQVLFAQAEKYESLPPEEQDQVQHHVRELMVVLIKDMVSDQLAFVSRAKRFLTLTDLKEIYRRRIGRGKIGGKAAGMLLAWRALQQPDPDDNMDIASNIVIPDSYFIGADVYYDFKALNNLVPYMNQKYRSQEEIQQDYPGIREAHLAGRFPEEILQGLKALLQEVGSSPLIVRSSSLLEDSLGASFAGKYDSVFCPNQDQPEQNLKALVQAICLVYASVLSPEALAYRSQQGLTDYDERMGVLIQTVQGSTCGDYFFPTLAGVAFGRNPFRWTQRIRREDGLVRLVWGLGTRAVDRVPNDHPRMIALSHPGLRPEKQAKDIYKYSQHLVDLLDLKENLFKTIPVAEVLTDDYPFAVELASVRQEDGVFPLHALSAGFEPKDAILTFDNLLSRTGLVPLLSAILKKLERQLQYPVDVEFTADILPDSKPGVLIHLLQCRPLSSQDWGQVPSVPLGIPAQDQLFSCARLVPHGHVSGVRFVVYIDPDAYASIPDYPTRFEVARLVGRLNKRLDGQRFILMGPGRWGSTDASLGVKATYAEIYNAKVLVEIAADQGGYAPEASYGTHFFQDLVEAGIYPLAVYPSDSGTFINWDFFRNSPNVLETLLPSDARFANYVKVIDLPAVSGGRLAEILMNAEEERALAFLTGPS